MLTTVTVLEWNLNFGGDDSVEPAEFVVKYMKDFDVIVLTEVKLTKGLESMLRQMDGYQFISSDNRGGWSNQVVILAREALNLKKVRGAMASGIVPQPDFLHGTVCVNGQEVNLVGIRIQIGGKISDNEYKDRYVQFQSLKKYLDTLENVACFGDFNSGQIRGFAVADYDEVESLYRRTNDKKDLSPLRFYNFHLMKHELGEKYVLSEPHGEDDSFGLWMERYSDVLHYGSGSRLKNDLFITKGIVGIGKYSWDHVRDHEREYMDMLINEHKRGNKIIHGYPDHARLMVVLGIECTDERPVV